VVSRTRTVTVVVALLALALSGCGTRLGTSNSGKAPAKAAPAAAATPSPSAGAATEAKETKEKKVGILTDKLIAESIPRMGKVVTDAKHWVLYRFDEDTNNPSESACYGKCAEVWPPVLTDGEPELEGISAGLVGTVKRDDGSLQLTLGGWPLYRYIGDPKPGAWKGQMVAGTWFVAAPNGKKNVTCLPTATPKPVQPPSDAEDEEAEEAGETEDGYSDGYGGGDGY
jgi:predicted lipoprotein with Yx(FWY)xxD motif